MQVDQQNLGYCFFFFLPFFYPLVYPNLTVQKRIKKMHFTVHGREYFAYQDDSLWGFSVKWKAINLH